MDNIGDTVTEDASAGTDLVKSSVSHTLSTSVENLTLTGSASINGTGNDLNNTIVGNSAANTLSGGAGNDTLDGGAGADTLAGGIGDDVYYVDDYGDVVTEAVSAGTDTVYSSVGFALGANVEKLGLLGTAAINGIGKASNNVLVGNSAANTLGGNEGDDTLYGNDGNDYLVGGPGSDHLQGGNGSDTIVGNDGIDRLFGGAGADRLAGQGGNDELTGGADADQFYFNLNGGQDTIADFVNGADKFVLGTDIKNVNIFVTSNGPAALDLYDSASSTAHTYVLLHGIPTSQIDSSDFVWAA